MTTNPVNLLVLTSPISLGEIVRPITLLRALYGADAKGLHLFIYPQGVEILDTPLNKLYTLCVSEKQCS